MKAVIVAAGRGTRINGEKPKTLLPFHEGTVLSTIIANLSTVGVSDIVIVVGYQADQIREYVARNRARFVPAITLVENQEFMRGNGISVLSSEKVVGDDNFILSMSDHIVTPSAIRRVAASPSAANVLLVDPRISNVFDLIDATKVQTAGDRILRIGKNLTEFNALDCGIFRLTPRFYASMREQLALNRESISDAISGLIKNKDMEAVYTQGNEQWFDIDTPASYADALAQTAQAATPSDAADSDSLSLAG
jgi:choline kinase